MSAIQPVDSPSPPPRLRPVAGTLDLQGARWSILVVRDVRNGVRRLDRHALEDEPRPRLVDRESDHEVRLRLVDAETGLTRVLRTAAHRRR